MGINDSAFEARKLEYTLSFIHNEIDRLSCEVEKSKTASREIGKKFAEDSPFKAVYGGFELTELQDEVAKNIEDAENSKLEIYILNKLLKSPYFARVDFQCTSPSSSVQNVYIGLKNLFDNEKLKPIVCDWRAPISSLFYNDFKDNAYYDSPSGRIDGNISLKRQYKFENGRLVYSIDSDLKIDDDILRDALAESSQEKLKVIVNTIQREQNYAIRFDDSKNLLVCGPAGSGKTSIGLHRMAYLLYLNRNTLNSKDILMFTNNSLFSSYIADIIPELGEHDIEKATFYDMISLNIDSSYEIFDQYEQIEQLLLDNTNRIDEVKLKYSDDFLRFLDDRLNSYAFNFEDIKVNDDTILSKQDLLERYKSESGALNGLLRTQKLVEFAKGKISDYFILNRSSLLNKLNDETLISESAFKHFRMLKITTLNFAEASIKNAVTPDFIDFYLNSLQEFTKDGDVFKSTKRNFGKKQLNFEDALVIMYIKSLFGDVIPISSPKHILIDEAQDMCPLMHKILASVYKKSCFTLLADTNQAILPVANTCNLDILTQIYGCEKISMGKSYRSTKQINEFALLLLDGEKYEIFERDGNEVNVINSDNQIQTIIDLLSSEKYIGKSNCIITKTAEQALNLYNYIKSITSISLAKPDRTDFPSGTVVMPLSLTKGLEFDNVIIPYADEFDKNNARDRRYLYMMVTRALHNLDIVF